MILAALALAQVEPPPAPPVLRQVPLTQASDYNPADAIRDGFARCGDCRVQTQRFVVDRELHSGFHLRPIDRQDVSWDIAFENRGVETRFYRSLHSDYIPEFMTRLVHCDCTGRVYEISGGMKILQIVRFHLVRPRR